MHLFDRGKKEAEKEERKEKGLKPFFFGERGGSFLFLFFLICDCRARAVPSVQETRQDVCVVA